MSLFRTSLRPPAPLSDESVERYVAAIRATIQPDPGFRRRLRGHVLNRHVAVREGMVQRRVAREMGRVGRAVLYASFALTLSVTGAMAASQQAIPGDLFYPVKLQIEELRLRALPEELHDELAGNALAERIAELDRLAGSGNAAAVRSGAMAVERAYVALVALGGDADGVEQQLAVAAALLDRLDTEARAVLSELLGDLPAVGPGPHAGPTGPRVPPGQLRGGGAEVPSRPAGPSRPDSTGRPTPTARPDPTARPTETARPEPTPGATAPDPESTPKLRPTKPPSAAAPPTPGVLPGERQGPPMPRSAR